MEPRELIAKVRRIEIRTRKIVDELTGGAYHSVFKGQGIEFSEVREYAPGDEVRSIDWNVTARFGHPFVKRFEEEREITVLLLVDISGSGDFGSRDMAKNELSVELAALLSLSAIRNNDRVGLMLFSEAPELLVPPRKGRRHGLRVIRDVLACERRTPGTNIRAALEHLMKLTTRRAVVFLISDMLDDGFEGPLQTMAQKHDLTVMRIVDPADLACPATGWINLEDGESGQTSPFYAAKSARRRFGLQRTAAHAAQKRWLMRSGIDLVDLTVGDDYVKPLLQFFRQRARRR
mgnify:CR=1 FL=1